MPGETKQGRMGLGLALLALAFGCGGKAETQESDPVFNEPAVLPPFSAGATPPRRAPRSAAMRGPSPAPPPAMAPGLPPMVMSPSVPVVSGPIYEGDTTKAAAQNILMAYCGSCHGPAAPVEGSGGILFINDFEKLIAAGLIVPLSSATSRIVIVMQDGSMPPPSSDSLGVTEADLAVVRSYIDNPRFFPGLTPPAPAADAGVGVPADVPTGVGAQPPLVGAADAGVDVPTDDGAAPPVVGAADAGADTVE